MAGIHVSVGTGPVAIREIAAIVAAIDDRDPEAARRACIAHVEAAATTAPTILGETERVVADPAGVDDHP